jgi:hypothetical protein
VSQNNTIVEEDKQEGWVPDSEYALVITPDNLSFSKMKLLMTIISWNPWDINIHVLWNEMKVSEKWLSELKNLIQE